jgi:hypothetical protein
MKGTTGTATKTKREDWEASKAYNTDDEELGTANTYYEGGDERTQNPRRRSRARTDYDGGDERTQDPRPRRRARTDYQGDDEWTQDPRPSSRAKSGDDGLHDGVDLADEISHLIPYLSYCEPTPLTPIAEARGVNQVSKIHMDMKQLDFIFNQSILEGKRIEYSFSNAEKFYHTILYLLENPECSADVKADWIAALLELADLIRRTRGTEIDYSDPLLLVIEDKFLYDHIEESSVYKILLESHKEILMRGQEYIKAGMQLSYKPSLEEIFAKHTVILDVRALDPSVPCQAAIPVEPHTTPQSAAETAGSLPTPHHSGILDIYRRKADKRYLASIGLAPDNDDDALDISYEGDPKTLPLCTPGPSTHTPMAPDAEDEAAARLRREEAERRKIAKAELIKRLSETRAKIKQDLQRLEEALQRKQAQAKIDTDALRTPSTLTGLSGTGVSGDSGTPLGSLGTNTSLATHVGCGSRGADAPVATTTPEALDEHNTPSVADLGLTRAPHSPQRNTRQDDRPPLINADTSPARNKEQPLSIGFVDKLAAQRASLDLRENRAPLVL